MAKETYAAVLRLANPEVNKGFEVSFNLPNSNKPTKFVWNEKNKFEAEIPTVVTYVDDHKKKVVFHENYAKALLDAYGVKSKGKLKLLEFVRELTREEFEEKPFSKFADVEQPKPVDTEVQKESKPKGK